MYTVIRTGSAKAAGAELRALVSTAVPQVLAKALTFTAQRAQADILAEMPRVFEGGATAYTLNSTRIEPASAASLSARVAVKDQSTRGGTLPEDYLFPQVYAGTRKEKRFERAMRYAGLLRQGERAVIGRDAPVDRFGNLRRSELEGILQAVGARYEATRTGAGRARPVKAPKKTPYFAAQRGRITGVFKRLPDRKLLPVLILTTRQPRYSKTLDFEGLALRAAQREFQPIFNRLMAKAVQ
jgi:hypothetical protein